MAGSKYRPDLPKNYRWVSCAQQVEWSVSRHAHIAPRDTNGKMQGWCTTMCGATGSGGALHGRSLGRKPACPECVQKFNSKMSVQAGKLVVR